MELGYHHVYIWQTLLLHSIEGIPLISLAFLNLQPWLEEHIIIIESPKDDLMTGQSLKYQQTLELTPPL